ncbi:MAG TPA: acylphosphatase [Patescibacteria group bacterium]|nr:acylphosphatase [Patescibacteria group bacterium]
METEARRIVVSGRVQGVGFRWFVIEAARKLHLTGWARNLSDGAVEVVAQGTREALDALAAKLAVGPGMARVESVESSRAEPDRGLDGFHVRY